MAEEDCSINLIYKLSEDTRIGNETIFDIRYKLGEELAKKALSDLKALDFDMICPVPNTGKTYARGFADAVGISYAEAVIKLERTRTLHINDSKKRRSIIKSVIDIPENEIEGRKICLIDEAIFTGMTLKIVCEALRGRGVANISVLIPTPMCIGKCRYNNFREKNMLLGTMNINEACSFLGADRLIFQSKRAFEQIIKNSRMSCTDCFK